MDILAQGWTKWHKMDKLAETNRLARLLPLSECKRNYFVKFNTYENEY